MKKIRVTIVQELEVEDSVQLVDGVESKLIQLRNDKVAPRLEHYQVSAQHPDGRTEYREPSEELMDQIVGSIAFEKTVVEFI